MTNMLVTITPPHGKEPSVLQLPAGQVFPNADGTYTIPSFYCATLLRDGWQLAAPHAQ
jgi:hypothetical protein